MPKSINEWVKMIIQILAPLVIGWILLSATERGQKMLAKEEVINQKADQAYVDDQDAALEKMFDIKFESHDKYHEVTDKYLERIMDFWDIRYEDLKEQIDERPGDK